MLPFFACHTEDLSEWDKSSVPKITNMHVQVYSLKRGPCHGACTPLPCPVVDWSLHCCMPIQNKLENTVQSITGCTASDRDKCNARLSNSSYWSMPCLGKQFGHESQLEMRKVVIEVKSVQDASVLRFKLYDNCEEIFSYFILPCKMVINKSLCLLCCLIFTWVSKQCTFPALLVQYRLMLHLLVERSLLAIDHCNNNNTSCEMYQNADGQTWKNQPGPVWSGFWQNFKITEL